MKNKFVFIGIMSNCVFLLGPCRQHQSSTVTDTSKTSSAVVETSVTEISESSEELVMSEEQVITSTDVSDVRKVEPDQPVSQIRRSLYEAGINSRELTDDQLLQYAAEAKSEGIDVIKYIQTKVQ